MLSSLFFRFGTIPSFTFSLYIRFEYKEQIEKDRVSTTRLFSNCLGNCLLRDKHIQISMDKCIDDKLAKDNSFYALSNTTDAETEPLILTLSLDLPQTDQDENSRI